MRDATVASKLCETRRVGLTARVEAQVAVEEGITAEPPVVGSELRRLDVPEYGEEVQFEVILDGSVYEVMGGTVVGRVLAEGLGRGAKG